MRTLRVLGIVLVAAVVSAAVSTVINLRRPADTVGRGPLVSGGQGGGTLGAVRGAQASVVRVERRQDQAASPAPTSAPGAAVPADTLPGGTGVVIDSRGYVLTAELVVAGANSLSVAVPGGRSVPAQVVGSDPEDALTLLKVTADGLKPLGLGGAQSLDTGSGMVVLAAPPYAQAAVGAVASAHASASIPDPSDPSRARPLNDLLALDVAPREGQLGAPVLDGNGRLAGMVVVGGSEVFAADLTQAQPLLQQLIDSGHLSYPTLGFEYRQLSVTEAADRGVPGGVVVVSTTAAAVQAGLNVGDVVVSADGTVLDPAHPLSSMTRSMTAKQNVNLAVRSQGGLRNVTLAVELVTS